jgi:hypothetical protein
MIGGLLNSLGGMGTFAQVLVGLPMTLDLLGALAACNAETEAADHH